MGSSVGRDSEQREITQKTLNESWGFSFGENEFKLARVGNNVPRGTLIMIGRCQLKLFFREKEFKKSIK